MKQITFQLNNSLLVTVKMIHFHESIVKKELQFVKNLPQWYATSQRIPFILNVSALPSPEEMDTWHLVFHIKNELSLETGGKKKKEKRKMKGKKIYFLLL